MIAASQLIKKVSTEVAESTESAVLLDNFSYYFMKHTNLLVPIPILPSLSSIASLSKNLYLYLLTDLSTSSL